AHERLRPDKIQIGIAILRQATCQQVTADKSLFVMGTVIRQGVAVYIAGTHVWIHFRQRFNLIAKRVHTAVERRVNEFDRTSTWRGSLEHTHGRRDADAAS